MRGDNLRPRARLVQLGCEASFILGSARRRQRPAVDIDEDHVSDPSVRFVVEQQLINEFTIQAKPLGDRRRVRHAFHAQPVQDEQFGGGHTEHGRSLLVAHLLPTALQASPDDADCEDWLIRQKIGRGAR